jgi:hypothetical protein
MSTVSLVVLVVAWMWVYTLLNTPVTITHTTWYRMPDVRGCDGTEPCGPPRADGTYEPPGPYGYANMTIIIVENDTSVEAISWVPNATFEVS